MTDSAMQTRGDESWRATWLVCVALLLIGAFATARITGDFRAWTSEEIRRIRVLDAPRPLSTLELVTATGTSMTLWNAPSVHSASAPPVYLMHFMYTRCPSYCRVLGSEFEHIQRQLGTQPADARITLLSISFDPAFDTPSALRDYQKMYRVSPSRWTVAAPRHADSVERMLVEAGVVVIPDGMGGYAHNAAIHVASASGQIVRIFDFDAYEEALAYARAIAE